MALRWETGQRAWGGEVGEDGHRTYHISFLVETSLPGFEGPASILQSAGLPCVPGDPWVFGVDVDVWAYCLPDVKISEHGNAAGSPAKVWLVEFTFSTRPPDVPRCFQDEIGNPLLEPDKVSGTFNKYTEEVTEDRFGIPIQNSAWEQIRGPQVEFDDNRPSVTIEQNRADLDLELLAVLMDSVNDAPMWGFEERMVKLSQCSWEKKYYGSCDVYYVRRLTFDINYSTFDRDLLDEGTKVLYGHWGDPARGDTSDGWVTDPWPGAAGTPNPDPNNPHHFIRAKDRNGENIRVVLDGAGKPVSAPPSTGTGTGTGVWVPGSIHVERYDSGNLFLLGVPASL